jgi:hypothetical protein
MAMPFCARSAEKAPRYAAPRPTSSAATAKSSLTKATGTDAITRATISLAYLSLTPRNTVLKTRRRRRARKSVILVDLQLGPCERP